ncbi:TIGR02587 family membrane protein [Salinirubellus salinus]|jgi:uncharacterized membrane protein|uniref:TIGR02587 family membrane protein n=1 Tax=Salinirubellus salinus TaxID=1364945 RepID=A0A9E7R1P1_9EURY|nr:TIGR02587 family membrane protein [Salinirubellus salinus]UWM54111.1 TIGR02587 family membrane protein [Salinirubellus salinus]
MSHSSRDSPAASASDEEFDVEDVYEELEELEGIVDSAAELEQVRETMRVLRLARRPPLLGRLSDSFDSRDVGEAVVGSFLFGMPMIVEDGTLEIGRFIAGNPLFFALTVAFGFVLVYEILHAVEFEKVEADLLWGVVPVRLVGIPTIAGVMALVLMTIWGRVEWATPLTAAGQVTVTAIVMAVGASLGDVLPGT